MLGRVVVLRGDHEVEAGLVEQAVCGAEDDVSVGDGERAAREKVVLDVHNQKTRAAHGER